MKKLFLILTIIFIGLAGNAKSNYLHSITLEKNSNSYNIILNSDEIAKVTRRAPSDNSLILELSGIKSADTVNALYKGASNIDNLVIENNSHNKLKIYISAQNIKDASIIMEPLNGSASVLDESFPLNKILLGVLALAMFSAVFVFAKKSAKKEDDILIKKDIKDREIEMYKKYRKSLEQDISINSKKELHMRNMLKKIDRKIDERLSSLR
ncbi:hypothetical protein J6G99_06470 [bacterium]|nr:hypothetical protein [bacterium]